MLGLSEWQRRFQQGVRVFYTGFTEQGIFEVGNFYASKEAAEEEVAFYKRQGRRLPTIYSSYLHTLELAQDRWQEP